jgi:hypothetical protein
MCGTASPSGANSAPDVPMPEPCFRCLDLEAQGTRAEHITKLITRLNSLRPWIRTAGGYAK